MYFCRDRNLRLNISIHVIEVIAHGNNDSDDDDFHRQDRDLSAFADNSQIILKLSVKESQCLSIEVFAKVVVSTCFKLLRIFKSTKKQLQLSIANSLRLVIFQHYYHHLNHHHYLIKSKDDFYCN